MNNEEELQTVFENEDDFFNACIKENIKVEEGCEVDEIQE